eukprot:CAMPEP_0174819538 /NCGR_PEP_ID=MMETSP1107-20130205/2830_1 /TAXON_ID=36770 /ORGANISM="Paraphysomonas vestita, Strain GFlagA" /LENGTH=1018 /DNA_ID=CAMNT_0016033223 /DNA_START=65 /DNA_END=3121 /DNA_ORIENTATION=+
MNDSNTILDNSNYSTGPEQKIHLHDNELQGSLMINNSSGNVGGIKRGANNDNDLGSLRKRPRDDGESESDEGQNHMVAIEQSAEEIQVDSNIEPGFKTGPWIYDEDERLIQAVGVFKKPDGNINWGEVTRFIGDRSQKQCYVRWNTLLKYRGMGTRRGAWTAEEDSRLTEAVARHERKGGGVYWAKVSEEMGGDRTYQQCLKRWKQVLQHVGSGARTCAWTEQEDARLVEAMALYDGQGKGGGVDWTKVSEYLGGMRAGTQCYKRWHDALKQRRKSLLGEDWTPQEDFLVVQAVSLYAGEGLGGGVDWEAVSTHLGGTKSSKQCNRRWNRVLKIKEGVEGRIRTDPWDPEEERLLLAGIEVCRIIPGDQTHLYQQQQQTQHIPSQNQNQQQQQQLSSDITNQISSSTTSINNNNSTNNNNNVNVNDNTTNTSSSSNQSNDHDQHLLHHQQQQQQQLSHQDHVDVYNNNSNNNNNNTNLSSQNQSGLSHDDLNIQQHQLSDVQYHQLLHDQDESQQYQHHDYQQHDLAQQHLNSLVLEVDPNTVDWVRVSIEYLGSLRTPKQCERRFEALQRQTIRDGYLAASRESIGSTGYSDHGGDTPDQIGIYDNGPSGMMQGRESIESNRSSSSSRRNSLNDRPRTTLLSSSYYRHRGRAIKTGPWVPEEDDRLIEAVALYEGQGRGGAVDWGRVCEYMGGDRTYDQCRIRWNGVLKVLRVKGTVVKNGPWSAAEDDKLIEGVGIYEGQGKGGGVDWGKVSEYMLGERTPNQCHTRWNSVLKHRGCNMKTSAWTDMEDIKLTEAVGMYDGQGRGGTVDWAKVRAHLGNERSSYQHRMRWHSVLKHRVAGAARTPGKKDVVIEPWADQEVELLIQAVEECGANIPTDGSDLIDDNQHRLHLHQHHSSGADSNDPQSRSSIGLDGHEISSLNNLTGPIASLATTGVLIAHAIDWVAVSNKLAEDFAMSGGIGGKRTPLQCLHMWRQVMNNKMRDNGIYPDQPRIEDPNVNAGLHQNSPWTYLEVMKN